MCTLTFLGTSVMASSCRAREVFNKEPFSNRFKKKVLVAFKRLHKLIIRTFFLKKKKGHHGSFFKPVKLLIHVNSRNLCLFSYKNSKAAFFFFFCRCSNASSLINDLADQ